MFLDQYSREFEKTFMDLVRRRFRFKSILAKRVYNEFIQDREHVHMNATRWETLTEFVLYLGKAGLCEVTNTEQGLVIRYIDRDPARKASQEAMRMREKEELNAEQRRQKRLEAQMRAYKELYGEEGDAEAVAGEEEEDPEGSPPEKKVCPATESEEPKTGAEPSVCFSICQPKPVVKQPPLLSLSAAPSAPAPAPTTLDELRIEQERRKEQLGPQRRLAARRHSREDHEQGGRGRRVLQAEGGGGARARQVFGGGEAAGRPGKAQNRPGRPRNGLAPLGRGRSGRQRRLPRREGGAEAVPAGRGGGGRPPEDGRERREPRGQGIR
ncbi:DNA/RNA-binding protein KIN17-like [Schistocerca gregaria]|uniref:DNA/RNA-binding protein KIN17-like n=1 Tax=Schistocerca gregaria TaxID=7010 RepID=UPI00211DF5DB|nr:DNA/RNA-binding protein KIN17-like [Schistocerca gregaria]